VQWQDLSTSEDIVSTDLVPYLNMDDQDVWPTDYVLLKAGEVLMDEPGGVGFDRKKSDMLGIVQSVNAKERTTQVKWFSEERDQGLEAEAEEFSLYEIMSHPDLKFRMGDKVVVSREREQAPSSDIAPRAPSVDDILSLVGRGNEIFNELMKSQGSRPGASGHTPQQLITRDASVLLSRYGVEGLEALDRFLSESNKMASNALYWLVDRGDPLKPMIPDDVLSTLSQLEQDLQTIRPRLNWVGQIWEVYRDRPAVLVRFMDGTEAEFPVGRIMVIEDDEDDDEDDEEDDDEEFEEYDFDDDIEEVSSDGSWETDSGEEDDSMSDLEEETTEARDNKGEEKATVGGEALLATAPIQSSDAPAAEGDIAPKTNGSDVSTTTVDPLVEEPDDVDTQGTTVPEHPDWKSFAILGRTPADHHYLSHRQPEGDKAWFRRIAKEHGILRSSLPDGIRVRAFEDRLDLLRVLIQGPDHTPYRNALFMFDFKLPSQFPSQVGSFLFFCPYLA